MEEQALTARPDSQCSVLSASRLIAERTIVNDTKPEYFNAFQSESGLTVSVDEVWFKVRFSTENGVRFNELAGTVQCDGIPDEFTSTRHNSWRFAYTYKMGSGKVYVGIGWIEAAGKTDMGRAVVKFNPNKVANARELPMLLQKIGRLAKRVELDRFDMAIDIPVDRPLVHMLKDARGYEFIDHGHGITEYLGARSKPGRVKLYDKAKESGLDGELTRLELTCSASWSAAQVIEKFPRVYAWGGDGVPEETRAWVRACGLMGAKLLDKGETIEPYLNILGRAARKAVMAYITNPAIEVTERDAEQAIERANYWLGEFGTVA